MSEAKNNEDVMTKTMLSILEDYINSRPLQISGYKGQGHPRERCMESSRGDVGCASTSEILGVVQGGILAPLMGQMTEVGHRDLFITAEDTECTTICWSPPPKAYYNLLLP